MLNRCTITGFIFFLLFCFCLIWKFRWRALVTAAAIVQNPFRFRHWARSVVVVVEPSFISTSSSNNNYYGSCRPHPAIILRQFPASALPLTPKTTTARSPTRSSTDQVRLFNRKQLTSCFSLNADPFLLDGQLCLQLGIHLQSARPVWIESCRLKSADDRHHTRRALHRRAICRCPSATNRFLQWSLCPWVPAWATLAFKVHILPIRMIRWSGTSTRGSAIIRIVSSASPESSPVRHLPPSAGTTSTTTATIPVNKINKHTTKKLK